MSSVAGDSILIESSGSRHCRAGCGTPENAEPGGLPVEAR